MRAGSDRAGVVLLPCRWGGSCCSDGCGQGDFEDLAEAAAAVLAFEKHYNAVARPFDWRFTRASLNQLLARVQKHDRHTPKPEAA